MKQWDNIFKVIIIVIGMAVLAFDAALYNLCEQQRMELNTMSNQQKLEMQVNSNKFKDQEQEIVHLRADLDDADRQIKNQNDALADEKDALLQEVEKRQQIENETKSIQTSMVDLKAEADAIKQDMEGWQKDYVAVLAQLEKKTDDSQDEIKVFEDNLKALNIPELKKNIISLQTAIEKIAHPPDNNLTNAPPVPEKKIERTDFESQ